MPSLRKHLILFLALLTLLPGVQVEMLTAQEIQCPISLEAPVCPQITPCGHVFAFPSILAHLMNHGGENLRKASPCPLCFQPIVARELRLVQIKIVTPPKVLPMSSRVITSLALSTASLLQQGMP